MNSKVLPNRRAVGHAKPLRIVSGRAKSYASIAPYYVIALSQTDTVEQGRWMRPGRAHKGRGSAFAQ